MSCPSTPPPPGDGQPPSSNDQSPIKPHPERIARKPKYSFSSARIMNLGKEIVMMKNTSQNIKISFSSPPFPSQSLSPAIKVLGLIDRLKFTPPPLLFYISMTPHPSPLYASPDLVKGYVVRLSFTVSTP